jgi:hypothetical protein|tara:strand:+ start:12065 stop:12223 length:159 start_codon:yes stop_codon:yes gene_type:complete
MKKLSEQSWSDIYTIYYETKDVISMLVPEGRIPAIHLSLYLDDMNQFNEEEE